MLPWKRDPRRRLFFIKKEFQGKFILLYASCVLVPAGLAVLAVYVQARANIEKHLFSTHLKITHTGEVFSGLLIKSNLVSTALMVVLVIFFSLYIFHRLNMHFYRMEERLDAIGSGDFSHPPQPLSRFNEVSTLIHLSEQTRQNYRERFVNVENILNKLEKSLSAGGTTVELREVAKELAAHRHRVILPEPSSEDET